MPERETIIEVRVSGAYAQVNAIDVESGLEVSVTTPATASRADQNALALRKLNKARETVVNEQAARSANTMQPQKNGDVPLSTPPQFKRGLIA